MYEYENVLSASKGLLVEVVNLLSKSSVKFVVIGGWCPYLRNASTTLTHPGTKDVDILFSDGNVKGQLNEAIEILLENGFLVSAKHDFQLLKQYKVGSNEFVFNIDLLHPSETLNNPEMMVDHFNLGVTESDLPGDKHVKSIVLPSSQLIFEGFYSSFPFSHTQSDGEYLSVDIPLIDAAGLVLSKCQSVKLKKRPRDSYDIYLMLMQGDVKKTCEKLRASSVDIPPVKELLVELRDYLNDPVAEDEELKQFDFNAGKYMGIDLRDTPSSHVKEKLDEILA